MRDTDDVSGLSVDVPPPVRRISLGFNPMEWTVGAGLVVLTQTCVIAVLLGALLALVRR